MNPNHEEHHSLYRLNIDQIQKYLPHRAPFLMIDRILEIHPMGDLENLNGDRSKVGIRVKGLKSVTFNENYMTGHFPGFAIMPGVLMIESMAQTACFSLYPYMLKDLSELSKNFRFILTGVNETRFRRPVVPGDTLIVESIVARCRGPVWVFATKASVDGQLAAEAELTAHLAPKGTLSESIN